MTATTSRGVVSPRATAAPETPVAEREDGWYARRLLAGALAGIAGGLAMYAVLAVAAVVQGRGASYPFHAVHAMMSGGRVLPEDPGRGTGQPQVQDALVGPVLFLLPALLVGVFSAAWAARRAESALAMSRVAALPAAVLTLAFFLVFVLLLGFRPSSPEVQRVSSGYGVRQLGVTAWAVGHVVYLAVALGVLAPLTRALDAWRRRRRPARRA